MNRRTLVTLAVIQPFLLFLHLAFPYAARALEGGEHAHKTVEYVYDGDTIRTTDGIVVRYIGIDTPEKGEPLYERARLRNVELVGGKVVSLVVCRDEPRDIYGRTLAWVWVDGLFVNGALLGEGLATTLIIPPCGLERATEILGFKEEAQRAGLGIWR